MIVQVQKPLKYIESKCGTHSPIYQAAKLQADAGNGLYVQQAAQSVYNMLNN